MSDEEFIKLLKSVFEKLQNEKEERAFRWARTVKPTGDGETLKYLYEDYEDYKNNNRDKCQK